LAELETEQIDPDALKEMTQTIVSGGPDAEDLLAAIEAAPAADDGDPGKIIEAELADCPSCLYEVAYVLAGRRADELIKAYGKEKAIKMTEARIRMALDLDGFSA